MNKCSNCLELEQEITNLKERLHFIESKACLQAGFKGEHLVSEAVSGVPTIFTSPHDVEIKKNGIRIEVKFSNVGFAVKGRSTKRWTWARVLGANFNKSYDRLILVGESDDLEGDEIIAPGPYVYFDIPFDEVEGLMRRDG